MSAADAAGTRAQARARQRETDAAGRGLRDGRAALARLWPDALVAFVLGLIAAAGFTTLAGAASFLLAALGGLVIGTAAMAAARLFSLPAPAGVAFGVVGYFLFGGVLAVPSLATDGILPGMQALSGLVRGAVFGWSDALTLQAPLQAPPYIAVVPYLACWLCGLIATGLALWWPAPDGRAPVRRVAAGAAPLALLVTTILFGTHSTFLAGIRAVLFAVVALVWLAYRRTEDFSAEGASHRSAAARRRLTGVAVLAAGALVIGGGAGLLATPLDAHRVVLRDHVEPPFDPSQYPSPLAAFRSYVNDDRTEVLFSESGLNRGDDIRIATMDAYDGVTWNVAPAQGGAASSGAFRLYGATLPQPPLFDAGTTSKVTFTVHDWTGPWLPSASYPSGIRLTSADGAEDSEQLRANTGTGTLAYLGSSLKGLGYTLDVTQQKKATTKQLDAATVATVTQPSVVDIPDAASSAARQFSKGDASAYQALSNIAKSLRSTGYLEHGRSGDPVPSRAGEGADRITDLLTLSPMVGDQEQYASAFALMARALGYPVRVVLGATVPTSGSADITGSDMTAWDEVPFTGIGWIAFDPTPTQTNAPKEQTTKTTVLPVPQVLQPPRTQQKDDNPLPPTQTKNAQQNQHHQKPPTQHHALIPRWVWEVAGVVLGAAVLIALPFLILFWLRSRRRGRRLAGAPHAQAAGAWAELSSSLAELGVPVPLPAATRIRLAGAYEQTAPQRGVPVPSGALAPLAARVDGAVFAAGEPSEADVAALWQQVDGILAHARSRTGGWRRFISRLRYSRR